MQKNALIFTILFLIGSSTAFADVHVASSGMGGNGDSETWLTPKKRRMDVSVNAMGINSKQIHITRTDLGVEWTVDNELKMYEEKPIAWEYKPSEDKTSETDKEQAGEGMSAMADATNDICEPKTNAVGQKTFMGLQATGYQSVCPGRPADSAGWVTWMVHATPELMQFRKDDEAFGKALRKQEFSKYPPADRKMMEMGISFLGNAMGQGLLGFKADALPKDLVPVAMEVPGAEGGMMYEMKSIQAGKLDESIFEIPAGFKKVDNLDQIKAEAMARQMYAGTGIDTDGMFAEMKKMQQQQGMQADEAQQEAQAAPPAEEPQEEIIRQEAQNSEEEHAEEQNTNDFDAQNYAQEDSR